jgi:enoyl-CoA hydratase/carnithine racemase
MADQPELIHYERDGKVGIITLDRPPRNAYTNALHAQLERAWQRAAADDEATVILERATGDHFCAGAELTDEHDDKGESVFTAWDFYDFIRNVPKPTIAAVQSACIGGGLRFVWPCDIIIASDDAFFRDPTVRFGIGGIQSHGHTWEWGPRLAKEVLFTGGRLPAQRLYEMGTVNRIVPRAELDQTALDLAQEIATMPPFSLRQAKRTVNMTMDLMGYHFVTTRFYDLIDGGPQLQTGR